MVQKEKTIIPPRSSGWGSQVVADERLPKPWRLDTRVTDCGACKTKPTIIISWEADNKARGITSEVHEYEWLGYLIGKYNEKTDTFTVTDIFVPEQVVSAGSVDVTGDWGKDDVIGTIHLHPDKAAPSFSPIDDNYIGGNHPMMVVTNLNGLYAGRAKVGLPCDHTILKDAEVLVDIPEIEGLSKFVIEVTEKIKVFVAPVHTPGRVVAQAQFGGQQTSYGLPAGRALGWNDKVKVEDFIEQDKNPLIRVIITERTLFCTEPSCREGVRKGGYVDGKWFCEKHVNEIQDKRADRAVKKLTEISEVDAYTQEFGI